MVQIVIGNIDSKIVGILPDQVNQDLDRVLSYKHPDARHIPSVKARKWDGVFHLYKRSRGQSFYTGLLSLVREVLDRHKIEFTKIDRRVCPTPNMPELKFVPSSNYEERDYQSFTIDRSIKFTRGVLGVCTGGGKTMMVTRMIGEIKTAPFIFYVLTKDLMRQAHEDLSECLNQPIGMIGDSQCDIQNITVCTIQTAIRSLNQGNPNFKISDYIFDDEDKWDEKGIENAEKSERIRDLIRNAKGVYFDEIHHASAKTCQDVLTASSNAFWRFGGSATPYREDGSDLLIQAMFGAKVVDINASYLIKRNFLVKPYIYFVPVDNQIDYRSWQKIYKFAVVENQPFNAKIADTANHIVSRGLSTLVLVQHYPQGDMLKTMIPGSEFITGRSTTKHRTESLRRLESKDLMCLIATSLADEGLDIPTLDSAILAGGGASSTRINQRIGRTIRRDKSKPKDKSIVIMYDHFNTRYLQKHTKKVRAILKREEEFVVRDSKGFDFINGEIDKTLGIENTSRTIFDS